MTKQIGNTCEGFIYEEKRGNKYTKTFECYDGERTYRDLTNELISKKINACTWIKSIKRTPLYNGFDKITVNYDHGGRRVYTVTSR